MQDRAKACSLGIVCLIFSSIHNPWYNIERCLSCKSCLWPSNSCESDTNSLCDKRSIFVLKHVNIQGKEIGFALLQTPALFCPLINSNCGTETDERFSPTCWHRIDYRVLSKVSTTEPVGQKIGFLPLK